MARPAPDLTPIVILDRRGLVGLYDWQVFSLARPTNILASYQIFHQQEPFV